MDKGLVRKVLEEGNYTIEAENRYRTYAWRFKLSNKVSVYCGDKNKIWCQGKARKEIQEYLDEHLPTQVNTKVFIVYGRDLEARNLLVEMLTEWGLTPLAIDSLPTQGRTIIEQLEKYIPETNFGIVLATPDDKGYLAYDEANTKYRARQNVVLELGMLFSKLGRNNVAVILKECIDFEKPSDIDGIMYHEYSNSVKEVAEKLKRELNSCGYNV